MLAIWTELHLSVPKMSPPLRRASVGEWTGSHPFGFLDPCGSPYRRRLSPLPRMPSPFMFVAASEVLMANRKLPVVLASQSVGVRDITRFNIERPH
jgi:hypothetical protein